MIIPIPIKLTQRCPAAANTNECLSIRPIALTSAMSVNIDIRAPPAGAPGGPPGEGGAQRWGGAREG